jgi:uncharacterized membrane protein
MGSKWTGFAWGALTLALGLVFAAAGITKLVAVSDMVRLFDDIGLGAWFMYLVGALEMAGGLALVVRRQVLAAACGLAGLMIGAVGMHLFVIGGSPIPALVLLGLLVLLAGHRLRLARSITVTQAG